MCMLKKPSNWLFLSTLPARGATHYPEFDEIEPVNFYPRSPRGERLGDADKANTALEFLSTLPARGATKLTNYVIDEFRFLSTLPARGATAQGARKKAVHGISIHAPREGSDPA